MQWVYRGNRTHHEVLVSLDFIKKNKPGLFKKICILKYLKTKQRQRILKKKNYIHNKNTGTSQNVNNFLFANTYLPFILLYIKPHYLHYLIRL